MQTEMVLKGGRVIDPAQAIDGLMDVAIAEGKITRVAPQIQPGPAAQTVDVSGLCVTPGILDIHTHVYKFRPTEHSYVEGVNADAHLFASGVTTTVDAGTAGWEHFPDFIESTVNPSKTRILAFLNIAGGGMVDARSEQRPADMDVAIAAGLARAYPEIIVGIKSAHYWTRQPWDAQHAPWLSVQRAIEAGEECGLPVMVDFWPRPPERPYPDLLRMLRPGDIHTHVFAQQFPILDSDGRVNRFLFEARERGVRFDLGHGAASFWFRNAFPALRGGFAPDSLSTDLHMANIHGPVFGMAVTMSKYLSMGMALEEVVRRSTSLPAQIIGRPNLGTLAPGAAADVAVFRVLNGSFGFPDCGRARLVGTHKLECLLTLRAGEVVYDPSGRCLPDWQHAPREYWNIPDLQA